MLNVRLGWTRIAVGVAGASCLAATACGGVTASSSAVAPSASSTSTADPLAGVSASRVVAETVANAEAAPSLTIDGTVNQQGVNATLHLGIKRGVGCTGSVGLGSQGTLKVIMIGNTVYLNPDKQFWTANAGANASAAIALVNGRYLKVPASDKNVASFAGLCTVSKLLDPGSGDYTKGAITTLDGKRVLAINGSDGSTGYVTDTSKPEFVEVTAPKGDKNGSGEATVSVGAPVTLAAPSASEVIDGTTLGM